MRIVSSILTQIVLAYFFAISICAHSPPPDKTTESYPILSGVGMALTAHSDSIHVFKVLPDSVADRSDAIFEGDQIISVRNGDKLVRLKGKTVGEAVSLIRGPVSSSVTLEIRRKDQLPSFTVSLIREAIRLEGEPNTSYRELIGQTAPKLTFSRLGESKPVKLSRFKGKIVVLEFWATWCAACFQPIDQLQELARSHPEWTSRVELLTISVDKDRVRAEEIINQRKWTRTTHLSINPETLDSVGIQVLPVVMIISPDGKIASMGASHAMDVEKEVERLLASQDD